MAGLVWLLVLLLAAFVGLQWFMAMRAKARMRAATLALEVANQRLQAENRALLRATQASAGTQVQANPATPVADPEDEVIPAGYCPTCGAAYGLYGSCVCKDN